MGTVQKIKDYFQQPEEADFSFQGTWPSALGISAIIVVLVYFLNLKSSALSPFDKIFYSAIFGVITLAVSLFNDLILVRLLPKWFDEQKWTLGKNINYIIWNFLAIAVANMAFMVYKGWASFTITSFLQIALTTLLIGIFPVILISLISHNKKLKKRLQEANNLNLQLRSVTNSNSNKASSPATTSPSNSSTSVTKQAKEKTIKLSSNQQTVNISVSHLLYATSEKNYLRIILEGKEDLLIRNTMKNLEQALNDFPNIIRCHRAFMVNTDYIIGVNGNAQGYRLSLKSSSEDIPVSRTYIPKIKKQLNPSSL